MFHSTNFTALRLSATFFVLISGLMGGNCTLPTEARLKAEKRWKITIRQAQSGVTVGLGRFSRAKFRLRAKFFVPNS